MKRDTFATRTIYLRGPEQLQTAMALLPHLPLDADRPLELVVREEVKKRGLDANAYYWLRVGEIAAQAWLAGRQYNADVWHHYLRQNIMQDRVTLKDGTETSKWLEGPDGQPVPMSTTMLERKCFADYVTAVEAFGASLGVQFSANPNVSTTHPRR